MKNMKYIWVACLLIASVAFAIRQVKYSAVNDPNPQWLQQGYYLGTPNQNPVSDTRNKRGHHLCGSIDYDLPAVQGPIGAAQNNPCQDIPVGRSVSVAGCRYGDSITLGIDQVSNTVGVNSAGGMVFFLPLQGADGGAASLSVKECALFTDAGTFNMPDANYSLCCDGPT